MPTAARWQLFPFGHLQSPPLAVDIEKVSLCWAATARKTLFSPFLSLSSSSRLRLSHTCLVFSSRKLKTEHLKAQIGVVAIYCCINQSASLSSQLKKSAVAEQFSPIICWLTRVLKECYSWCCCCCCCCWCDCWGQSWHHTGRQKAKLKAKRQKGTSQSAFWIDHYRHRRGRYTHSEAVCFGAITLARLLFRSSVFFLLSSADDNDGIDRLPVCAFFFFSFFSLLPIIVSFHCTHSLAWSVAHSSIVTRALNSNLHSELQQQHLVCGLAIVVALLIPLRCRLLRWQSWNPERTEQTTHKHISLYSQRNISMASWTVSSIWERLRSERHSLKGLAKS